MRFFALGLGVAESEFYPHEPFAVHGVRGRFAVAFGSFPFNFPKVAEHQLGPFDLFLYVRLKV
jgi:hypothetical protein